VSRLVGLSLSGPWFVPMLLPRVRGGKRLENRTKNPDRAVIGGHVAYHCAKSWDQPGYESILELFDSWELDVHVPNRHEYADEYAGRIMGVSKLISSIKYPDALEPAWADQDVWRKHKYGSHGWLFEEPTPLQGNVRASGKLGLWPIEGAILETVRAEYADALRIAKGSPVLERPTGDARADLGFQTHQPTPAPVLEVEDPLERQWITSELMRKCEHIGLHLRGMRRDALKNMGIKDLREQAEIHHLGTFDPEWARLTLEKLPEVVK
jgi:hypothetical protein